MFMIPRELHEVRLEMHVHPKVGRHRKEPLEDAAQVGIIAIPDDAEPDHPATASLSCNARTRSAIPAASSPAIASCRVREAAGMIWSGTPWTETRTEGSSLPTTDAMCAPNPLMTVPSSTTSRYRCSARIAESVNASYGFRNRKFTTVGSNPSIASDSAASSAGRTIVPTARMGISLPRRGTSHDP